MPIEIDDDAALLASAVGTGLFAVWGTAAPANFNDKMLAAGPLAGTAMTRFAGEGWASLTAVTVVARSADGKVKKDLLKVAGASWAVAALTAAYNTHKGVAQKDAGVACTLVSTVLAGLTLWRGLAQ